MDKRQIRAESPTSAIDPDLAWSVFLTFEPQPANCNFLSPMGPRRQQRRKEHCHMKTIRNLVGLTGLLTVLAITPASANFQANQANTSQGPATQIGTSPVFSVGSVGVTCTTLEKAAWHIQTKFTKVSGNPTKVEQDLTKDGPHEQFTGQYNGCTATGGFAATVNSECSVQVIQGTSTLGTGAVKSECIIVATGFGLTCTIKIPAGNQNVGLVNVSYGNGVGDVAVKSEVTGITETATGGGCGVLGVTSGKAGEFKATVQASSQKVE